MEIPSAFDINTRLAQREAEGQRAPGDLGREAFLDLLITQLSNQDPLSPLQDHEFVAQLATFSSLEQLEGINHGIQSSLLMNQSVNNSLATNLIGKEILAEGSTVSLGDTGSPTFQLDLPATADVSVLVRDATGTLVKRIDVGTKSEGSHKITWDGTNESGARAAAGEYSIEVLSSDSEGLNVPASLRVRAEVTGVRFLEGTGFLLLGDTMVPLSSVSEVLAPPSR